jgi:DNA/RNA-binding domain of Phe-tRNA-synthetase-like protein
LASVKVSHERVHRRRALETLESAWIEELSAGESFRSTTLANRFDEVLDGVARSSAKGSAAMNGPSVKVEAKDVCIGWVWAKGCAVTANLDAEVSRAVAEAPQRAADETAKKAARDMLRFGKYKPTGRGKPASEYLLQAALENAFPRINALVDLCNIVSLDTLLPISLIDLARAQTSEFVVRRGRAGESYVFNAGGQTVELEDLLLTAKLPDDAPCANAVKDSLATKLGPEATEVLAIIYAPASRAQVAKQAADVLAAHYGRLCRAQVQSGVIKASSLAGE